MSVRRRLLIVGGFAALAGCATMPAVEVYRSPGLNDAQVKPAVLYASSEFSVQSVDARDLPRRNALLRALAPVRPRPFAIYLTPGIHEITFTWHQDFSGLRYATRRPATLIFATRQNATYRLIDRPHWSSTGLRRVRFVITRDVP
jgi:hypothetical protein